MARLAAARMSGGSEFHAAGPACENERSLNLVRSRGVTYVLDAGSRSQDSRLRVDALLDLWMMSLSIYFLLRYFS